MHTCPQCKGEKEVSCTIHTYCSKTVETMKLSCPTCWGKGEITQEKQEAYDFEQNMWCKCGNPSGHSRRVDDGEGIIHKHHYTCYDCGQITQVG